MMNSPIVSADISVNASTGITTNVNRNVTPNKSQIYRQNVHDNNSDDDSSLLSNYTNCHGSAISMPLSEPTCSKLESTVTAALEEPRTKKSRKQSNPVRYGHSTHQTAILPMELDVPPEDELDDDDDDSIVAAGLRVAEELQRPGSFGSSDDLLDAEDDDDDDDDMDDDKPLDQDRRKLIEHSITSVMNFHRNKYQYYCPHCSCSFTTDDELRCHIEDEHVQKLLERQLFHHQQQLSANNTKNNNTTSNGTNRLVRSASNDMQMIPYPISKYDNPRKIRSADSAASGSGSTSSGSNNNTPLQSPLGPHHDRYERKPFDTNLPQASSDHSAKDFSNFLPFQLPNMPPLISMSQSGGVNSDGKIITTSAGSGPMPLAMFPNPMAPFLFPVLPGQGNANACGGGMSNGGPPVNAAGVRIFNPEAYCELCNKEFCNKYFLKTHKANKHGIYSMDTIGTTVPGPYTGPFFPSGITTNAPNAQAAAAAAAMQMQQLLQAGAAAGAMHGQSEPGLATGRTGIINLESYCEICQKEFCNKYFLKKHKQKIHGIIDPNNPQQSSSASPGSSHSNEPQNKTNSPSPSPSMTSVPSFAIVPSSIASQVSTISGPVLSEKSQQSSTPRPGSGSGPQMVSVTISSPTNAITQSQCQNQGPYSCDICKQEFPNIVILQTHRFTAHGPPTSFSAMIPVMTVNTNVNVSSAQLQTMAALSQSMAGESPAGVITRPIIPPVSMASSMLEGNVNLIFTPEKLREMGVINADAFCEICCKEFCNKYFLRTHKINKHGMGIDGSSSVKSQSGHNDKHGDDSNNMSPKSSNNDDSGLEPGQRDPATYGGSGSDFLSAISNLTSANADLSCDICNRPFASNYLLKMHKFYSHNVPYIKEEDSRKSNSPCAGVDVPNDYSNSCHTNSNAKVPFDSKNQSQNHTQSLAQSQSLQRPQSGNGHQSDHTNPEHVMVTSAEQASQDLQKLQTMIKELNSSTLLDRMMCNFCRQEFENKYFLRVHMMNDHGVIPTDDGSPIDSATIMRTLFDPSRVAFPSANTGQQSGDSEAFCDICHKEFCSKYFLRTHRQNIHGIYDPPSPTETTPPLSFVSQQSPHQMIQRKSDEQIGPMNLQVTPKINKPQTQQAICAKPLTPVSVSSVVSSDGKPRNISGRNYCNICNKELCNKYFMKTHMLKMHGINIDEHPAEAASSSTIGGVTCDICQKELCSKYFLKVHKQNTHGIYEEPQLPKEQRNNDPSSGNGSQSDRDSQNAHGIDPNDTNNRYFSHYTEVCPLCERRFKSIKWLKTHMFNDHSDIVAMKPQDLSMSGNALQGHVTSPTDLGRLCILCGQSFTDRVALHIHLVKEHRTTDEFNSMSGGLNSGIKLMTSQASDFSPYSMDHPHSFTPVIQQMPLALQMPSRINGTTSPASSTGVGPKNNNPNTNFKNIIPITNVSTPISTCISTITTNNSQIIIPTNTSASPISVSSHVTNRPPITSINMTTSAPTKSLPLSLSSGSMPIVKRTGSGTRIYQCSYCNYSTRWLSNLYAHEKRHNRINTEIDKKFVCRVCHRAYRYNHSLQRHLHSHRASGLSIRDGSSASIQSSGKGLLSSSGYKSDKSMDAKFPRLMHPFGSSNITNQRSALPRGATTEGGGTAKVKRYRCSKCNRKFRTRDLCLAHIRAYHSDSRRIILSSASGSVPISAKIAPKVCKCIYCGFATRNYSILKIHITKHHHKLINETSHATDDLTQLTNKERSSPLNLRKTPDESTLPLVDNKLVTKSSPSDSRSDSSSRSSTPHEFPTGQQLQLAAAAAAASQQAQLPMTYAMPRSPPNAGSFIMQPFLITQPHSEGSLQNDTFVPSLVYLPVAHKVLQPVRVAFQLTPA